MNELNVTMGRLNGTAFPKTLDSYAVTYTPFITLFINETGFVFNHASRSSRTAEKIINWVKSALRPAYQTVHSQSEVDSIREQHEVVLVFQSNSSEAKGMKSFIQFSTENRAVRGVECVVLVNEDIPATEVITYKNYDEGKAMMKKKITFNNLIDFVKESTARIVPQLTFSNYKRVMNTIPSILIVVLKDKEDQKSQQILAILDSLKYELQNKVQMTYVYQNQKKMLKELRKDVSEGLPLYGVLLQQFLEHGRRHYYFIQQEVSKEMILSNIEKMNNKELEEVHISENIPKEQDPKKVQKVVYKNWEQVVLN